MKIALTLALLALFAFAHPALAQESGACTITISISQTASTDLHTFVGHAHICGVIISDATATEAWSLVEGTGTTCATNKVALIGGTTASAVGSLSAVAAAPWLNTAVNGDHLCLLQGSTTNISGVITALDR